jgi:hypothetical protein
MSYATSAPSDFSSEIADAEMSVATKYKTMLWEPEFGWQRVEIEGEVPDFHPPQMLAAYQVFNHLFCATIQRCWVHLAAEMQAGKTGVITTLIRLILSNAAALRILPNRIFVLTGMNDDAWRSQTRKRMPVAISDGSIQHNKGLVKIASRLRSLAGSEYLSNVLIVIDESHIAASMRNQPNKHIYQTLVELCPPEMWEERNIRIVTISATDPVKALAISESSLPKAAIVRLHTTSKYQSIEKLLVASRIRYLEDFGAITTPRATTEFVRAIRTEFADKPFYHIIRASYGKVSAVEAMINDAFPDARIIRWDADTKSKVKADGDSSSVASMEDINTLLETAPEVTTFIIIKNMFYAAKTLEDEHVGVLWDRLSSKDDTTLQSLIGRACGYEKSTRTIVYTSRQTVENYRKCWRELCSSSRPSSTYDVDAKALDKKMTGTRATTTEGKAAVQKTATMATPYHTAPSSTAAEPTTTTVRMRANEEDFASEWKEYKTYEEAKKHANRSRKPKVVDGFYHTSTTKEAKKLRRTDVLAIMAGKKTANMDWKKMVVGQKATRLYVGYADEDDSRSASFFVRTLTKLR